MKKCSCLLQAWEEIRRQLQGQEGESMDWSDKVSTAHMYTIQIWQGIADVDKDCNDDYNDGKDNDEDLLDQIRRIYGADVTGH